MGNALVVVKNRIVGIRFMVLGHLKGKYFSVKAILAFTLLCSFSVNFSKAATQEEWELTQINPSHLYERVNTRACYLNEKYFLGCIHATNYILGLATPSKQLANKFLNPELAFNSVRDVKIIDSIEDKTPHSSEESWVRNFSQSRIKALAWKTYYQQTINNPLDFKTLLDSGFARIQGGSIKYHVASALNEYFKNAYDPNTFITPDSSFTQTMNAGIEEDPSKLRSELLTDPLRPNIKIGYISITSFYGSNICDKFKESAKKLYDQGARQLILDLRNNLGGLRTQSTCIISAYLDKGSLIMESRDIHTNVQISQTRSTEIPEIYQLYKKPLIILQNAKSASGSELVAGALSHYGRAIIVGVRSYGKGTSQQTFQIPHYAKSGFILRKTVSRYHFPSGAAAQLHGIKPDIEAYSTPNPSWSDRFAMRMENWYINPVPAGNPLQNNPPNLSSIRECMKKRESIASQYSKENSIADYQKYVALEAASCHVNSR